MGYSVFVEVNVWHAMVMTRFGVNMCVALVACAAEETAYLMRREIGDNLQTLLELVAYAFEMMSLHHGEHNLLVDSERHIYLGALHYGGPVLVADGVTKFHRTTEHCLGILLKKSTEVDDQHRAKLHAEHDSLLCLGIVGYDIAVNDLSVAFESHGILIILETLAEETAFLCSPLVEDNIIHITILDFVRPLMVAVDIA
jgi:hypothetical protein